MRAVELLSVALAVAKVTTAQSSNIQSNDIDKDAFLDRLVSEMTVPEMVMQIFLMFADNVIGPDSNNDLYDDALRLVPGAGIGVIHDWYPMNKTDYNGLQKLNLDKSRLNIPLMQFGECNHGVGSFQQSMFPEALTMAASFDPTLTYQVGRAIAEEARSIGIHACLSPVLDICQDPRWGRCQEGWGEDHVLTTHMGVGYASGLSKNATWNAYDAVVPVLKHFAAHGSPESGLNTAPFVGHGQRQIQQQLFVPFRASIELGGAKGVMMAYNEIDGIPAPVNPMLYGALQDWGFDGFVTSDDTGDTNIIIYNGLANIETVHLVASSPADAIEQWLNAGGMISYYDYPLETYLEAIVGLLANSSVSMDTLKMRARSVLNVKYDLGLFHDPYIPDDIDPEALTNQHVPLTLEAAERSIVLLENRNSTLPLNISERAIQKIALVGPFADQLNYGDYAGQFGEFPVANSSTIQQAMGEHIKSANGTTELVASWGANTWLYNAQYAIPGYHLSFNGTESGLQATYYANTDFTAPTVQKLEVPVRNWGLYPPHGLPSNNFSAVWKGTLSSPVSVETEGFLGVAILYNSTAELLVDGKVFVSVPETPSGNFLSNIPSYYYSTANATATPPGMRPFTFKPDASHQIEIRFQSFNTYQKIENQDSLNAQIMLVWNLVDRESPISKAVSVAQSSDLVVLALGANWNSDGENGDRGSMELSPDQTQLAQAIYALQKPVILVLQGGRPFAISELYNQSAAVLIAGFGGQSAGQAITNTLFGVNSPGGRLPLTIPRSVGQLPVYYNYKPSAHVASYVDMQSSPAYPFGYGLSFTNFTIDGFTAAVGSTGSATFGANDTITFSVRVKNSGSMTGSHVAQVYLLGRVSQVTQPQRQLVSFTRVYLAPGESRHVTMDLDVSRYLRVLNRRWEWEVEKGDYTFALLDNGGMFANTDVNVTMRCTG